ncbi:GumC family protein [Mucilaginibacter lutimaris]|uniref:non-specific protein-tyrosine kinase n=1 Tax=Mucilaginibacter lutimaris TaxID=931629 RepID=A0ABW2ZB58_9SPHI
MTNNDNLNDFIDQEREGTNFRELLFRYLRYWPWIFLSIIFFLCLGYVYVKFATPLYQVETDLLIKDNKQGAGNSNDLLKDLDMFSSGKIIDNEIQILKSKTIMEKVVEKLNLETFYYYTQTIKQSEAYGNIPFTVQLINKNSNVDYNTRTKIHLLNNSVVEINGVKYPVGFPIKTEIGVLQVNLNPNWNKKQNTIYEVRFNTVENVAKYFSQKLRINPVSKQATVLNISLEDAIPQRGKDILNNLILEYNQAAIEDKNKITSNTLKFIDERLSVIAQDLSSVEKNVEQYKSSNQITDIGAESKEFITGIGANDAELNKIGIRISVLSNLENYLRTSGKSSASLPSMFGIDDPTLLGLVQQLGDIQLKRQSLLQTVPETNPIVSSFDDQITSLKQQISSAVENLKKGLQITRQQLEMKNNSFESVIKKVPVKERGLLDVMRQQEIKNNLFTYLLQKREETAMQLASGVADSRTLDAAWSSSTPVKPVKSVIYTFFLLIGVLLPIAIIYISSLLNFRITRKQDIEKVTKAPILAEISHSSESGPLLVVTKPRSMIAEQVRSLRTNLQFVISDPSKKVLLFTSSMSGEGKSFISLNLGASLAMSGKKVVILELDLRKPKLHQSLDISNDNGLSNYLIGQVDYSKIIKKVPIQENYYIITSGAIPPNPAELLVNGKIDELIEKLKTEFDYILLDAPPVGLVTDAQILGKFSDTTLYIVRHDYTAKSQLYAINNYYVTRKFKNLNIVMNAINLQKTYGYGYGYGYSYGYGGYYQEDEKEKKGFFKNLFNK